MKIDIDNSQSEVASFEDDYRQFYADIYAFHKRYYNISVEDFTALSVDIGKLGNKYPACRDIIVKMFERIEQDYVKRED